MKIVDKTPFLVMDGQTLVKDAIPLIAERLGIQNSMPNADAYTAYMHDNIEDCGQFVSLLDSIQYKGGGLTMRNNRDVDGYFCITEIYYETECQPLMLALKNRKDDFNYADVFLSSGYNRSISSTDFKTKLLLDAVNHVANDTHDITSDYNAMLLLGSLYLDAELMGKKTTSTFLELLEIHGYDTKRFGGNEYRVQTSNKLDILLCAKSIPHAIHILGTHMGIEDHYFIAINQHSGARVAYIRLSASKQDSVKFKEGLQRVYSDPPEIILEGKVSSYIETPKSRHKIGFSS